MLEYVRSWHKGMRRMENVNLVGGPGCPRGIWYGYDIVKVFGGHGTGGHLSSMRFELDEITKIEP